MTAQPAITATCHQTCSQHLHRLWCAGPGNVEMLWDLQIERYGEQYQDLSWGAIIGLIKEDQAAAGKQHHNAGKEKAVIKERFTTINATLQARALCSRHVSCMFTSEARSGRTWDAMWPPIFTLQATHPGSALCAAYSNAGSTSLLLTQSSAHA